MSLHVFANIATYYGTAANNRAETEGNITTLQKLIWLGKVHSTVSAEAIRFALRRQLATLEDTGTNRNWNEDTCANQWKDHTFAQWADPDSRVVIDDDLLGFMTADAASEEGQAGSANVRRAVLEVTRAVSLTPWPGDVTFNAASPGATPSAAKKGQNPVPYGTELHATRYQYGLALTPERLRDPARAAAALSALASLRTVAGNHGRFLFDFAPEAIVIRITDDPAPRLLYCFDTPDEGKTLNAQALLRRIEAGDVAPEELRLGTDDTASDMAKAFAALNVPVAGIKATVQSACDSINQQLALQE